MKTAIQIAILITLLTGLKAFAQISTKFPNPNAVWEVNEVTHGITAYAQSQTRKYFIQGDTIINDLKYSKLYSQTGYLYYSIGKPFDFVISDTISKPQYYGALRTDSNNCVRTILNYFPDKKPVTIYKFDLNINDSIWVFEQQNNDTSLVVVTDIDSVTLNNGEQRKRLTIIGGINPEYWIEGIGSVHGLFGILGGECFEYCRFNLNCYKENNIEIYNNYDEDFNINYCDLFDGSLSNIEYNDFDKSVQIKQSEYEIKLSFTSKYQALRLFDINGSMLSEYNISNKEQLVISKDNLLCGKIIIVQLIDFDNKFYSAKIQL